MNIALCHFQKIDPTDEDWNIIESSYDSTCFQTKQWCDYLKRIHYEPFIVKVFSGEEGIGFFIGERIWRGVFLVTAPYEGVGTYTQGLSMMKKVSPEERMAIYRSMAQWLVDSRMASYFQVDDWQLREDSLKWDAEKACQNRYLWHTGIRYEIRPTLYVSLDKPIEELWAGLHYKSCKYCVNKATKLGLKVRIIDNKQDIPDFVNVHYDQLYEVCKRKGMKPKAAQKKKRMQALCESLFPDRVLMVEVVGDDEFGKPQVMSSGIFCVDKGECSYWTGASYQRYQKYCPNELMVWEAMRLLNERGAGDLNFCGMANYKLKFGTMYAYVPRLVFTKYDWIYKAKHQMKRLYYSSRKLLINRK